MSKFLVLFITVPCFLHSQYLAPSVDIGYAMSSPKTDREFWHNSQYLKDIFHNALTLEYLFKTEQVGLAVDFGYIKKGNDGFVTNNLYTCLKIKRYYKNRLIFSAGAGFDYITSYSISNNAPFLYSPPTKTEIVPIDFFLRPSLGFAIIKTQRLNISPFIGFDFSLTPYNRSDNSRQRFSFYNRYFFISINTQYRFRDI